MADVHGRVLAVRFRLLPMRSVFLAAAIVLAAPPATAQTSDLAPPVTKNGPLAKLGSDLARLYQAQQEHGRTASEAFRLASGQVVGETVSIDATAADGTGAELLAELRALGLEDGVAVGVTVSGRLPVAAIGEVAALPRLRAAWAAQTITHRRPGVPASLVGAVEGEASRALHADDARSSVGVSGSGVRIGVLSDSYNHCARRTADADPSNNCPTTAADDVASGDLPADSARVVEELAGDDGSDEGRAMMQLARDVAPGAAFSFHTAFGGQADFAQGIRELAADGAHVIVDDVLNLAEPFFQDGVVAQAVTEVVGQGVAYFSSAGNQSDDSYESDFVDSGLGPAFSLITSTGPVVFDEGDLHDFDPSTGGVDTFQNIQLGPDESIRLSFQWAEPSFSASDGANTGNGATSDYDIYVVDAPRTTANVLAFGPSNNNMNAGGSGEPFEILSYENTTGADTTVYLAIVKFSGEDRFMKYIDFRGVAEFEYPQFFGNATSVAHNNAAAAMGVAAAAWFNTPAFNPNLSQAVVNSFSSFGGSRILFDTNGNRLAQPEDRMKPDLLGTDGDNNTFFGGDIFGTNEPDPDLHPNFFGTSAAAPNVAAVAALMIEAAGGPGAIAPTVLYDLLRTTADDVTPFELSEDCCNVGTGLGYDIRSGFGFVRADLAVEGARNAVAAEDDPADGSFRLSPPSPNPARSTFAVTLSADVLHPVTVALYDVLGRQVALLHDGPVGPTTLLALRVDTAGLAPGLYVVRASADGQSLSRTVSVAR